MSVKRLQSRVNSFEFGQIIPKIVKHKWLVVSCLVIAATVSLIYSFKLQPVYKTTAKILVAANEQNVVKFEDVALSSYQRAAYYDTQVSVIQSEAVAEIAYKQLQGYVPWDKWKGRVETQEPLDPSATIEALLKTVSVQRLGNTEIIEISVEDVDPKLAARIANVWAQAYITYSLESKFDLTQYASRWLEGEIESVRERLAQAEANLQQYRKENNIVDIASKEIEDTAFLTQLIQRQAELELELEEQLKYVKEKHPIIIGLRTELRSLEGKVEEEKQHLLALKEKSVPFTVLQREVETTQALYDSLVNRLKETETIQDLRIANARVISPAKSPRVAIRPEKRKNLLRALLLGFVIAFGIVMLLESLDYSIRSPEELKDAGLEQMALVPYFGEKGVNVIPEFLSAHIPHSPVAEAYRSLRTHIVFSAPQECRRVLAVTSAGPAEGKTTTTINLAIVFAQKKERTIVIDADCRHPKFHNIFGLSKGEGMVDILSGDQTDISVCIHQSEVPNLDVMQCGTIPPNPSELLASPRFDSFLQELSTRYDRILFDTPPVLAVTDAVILSAKVDGTIIVARAEKTHVRALKRTKDIIDSMSAPVLGGVLTMAKAFSGGGYYAYYSYHYGSSPKRKHRPNEMARR